MNAHDLLLYFSLRFQGEWDEILKAVTEKRPIDAEEVRTLLATYRGKAVTLLDDDYPECFRHASHPPFVLYYRGNLSLLSSYSRCLAVCGSREPSPYAESKSAEILEGVAKEGAVLAASLSTGICEKGLRAALPYGKAVAVLGTGFDAHCPNALSALQEEVGREGLLLSEYPPGSPVAHAHFLARDRLVAAIGSALYVGEASPHDGAMHLVALAISNNRDVCALPGMASPENAGNLLIKDGAGLVQTSQDLLDILGLHPRPKAG